MSFKLCSLFLYRHSVVFVEDQQFLSSRNLWSHCKTLGSLYFIFYFQTIVCIVVLGSNIYWSKWFSVYINGKISFLELKYLGLLLTKSSWMSYWILNLSFIYKKEDNDSTILICFSSGSFSEEKLFSSINSTVNSNLSKTFGYQFNSLIINSFIGKVRLIRVKASFSSTFALSL